MHSTGAAAVPATGRVRAAVHKQPFAAMDAGAGAAGHGGVYGADGARAWAENGVSRAVRVFIGASSTAWMQRHQRWWARTAERLDGVRTGRRRRLRHWRRLGATGSSGDLLAAESGGHVEAAAAADWSSSSEASAGLSDSDSGSDSDLAPVGSGAAGLDGGGLATPQTSGTVPMPRLADSPGGSPDVPRARRSADVRRVAGEPARRRSSLSAIRAFFHRGDRKADAAAAAAGSGGGETPPGRRSRAASVSGTAAEPSLPSPTTPTRRPSLLRRTAAAAAHPRAVTWQKVETADDAPDDGAQLTALAAVRLETASLEALSVAYTEASCRALRRGADEWAEMRVELRAGSVRFYAGTRGRAAAHVQLAGSARLSVFSALDVTLALAYPARGGRKARVAVFKLRTAAEAREWYVRVRGALGGGMPGGVAVGVPELGAKVHVTLGGGEDAWAVRRAAVAALLADPVVGRRAAVWLAAERRGHERVAVAWRRGDRLTWVVPSGSVDASGAWRVRPLDACLAGPKLAEASHALELRMLPHYPDAVCPAGCAEPLDEPPGVEGFVLLRRSDAPLRGFRPVLLAAHDGLLFVVGAPRAARHMDVTTAGEPAAAAAACERLYHPRGAACARQMCQARYMLKLAAVWLISGGGSEADGQQQQQQQQGTACRVRLATRAGAWVELWAETPACAAAWAGRLAVLRTYWTQRLLADVALRSRTCILNYALQGRDRDHLPLSLDERASAAAAIWHACVLLGCRSVIHSGMLYRKRRRHQGLRRVFCLLTRGHLVEFDLPHALGHDDQMAMRVRAQDALLAQMAVGSSMDASEEEGAQMPRLLFARSRTLALRRCYVVSRRADDLTTEDIMCEPWVMTDIGNYSGLRLADRLYADGVVSHDFIDDCVFAVWRPGAPLHAVLQGSPRSSADSCASPEPPAATPRPAGLRGCLAVYKARTAGEMELWVAAVNQEIRRMVEADAW